MKYLKDIKSLSKNQIMKISGFIVIMIAVFLGDNIQQERFNDLRKAYESMQNGEHQEAIQEFETYLSVDSKIYWELIEMTNDYTYTYEGVSEAIVQCRQLSNK